MPYRKKILVIEDDTDQWEFIRISIGKCMLNTAAVWTASVEQTLDYLQAQNKQQLPNLILLDLYLPRREDGWQLLSTLKQTNSYRLLPVIIFSQSDSIEDISESYERGCSSYMRKPLNAGKWDQFFTVLHNYWWQTVTLPAI